MTRSIPTSKERLVNVQIQNKHDVFANLYAYIHVLYMEVLS